MDLENYLRQGLQLQEIPVDDIDIPYIKDILSTVNEAQASLGQIPALKKVLPLTIVDKEEINHG